MITLAVDGKGDGLAQALVLHRLLAELEDPALGLDGGHVEHLDAAGALERLHEIRGDAVDHLELPDRSAAVRVDSSGMKRKVTFSTLGMPGFQ